jgi:hypothetical protein
MTTTSLTSNAIHRKQAAPRTLGELLILFEYKMAREISRGSITAKRDLSTARCTVKKFEQMHEAPARLIWLDDLVEIDQQLIAYLEGKGIVHQSAIQYVRNKDKLLEFAHARRWTCKKFELLQSWKPSRLALKGNAGGGLGVIDDAIARGRRPCDYTPKDFFAWRQAQLERGRSLLTVDTEQSHFRKRLRRAGLQKAFLRFSLGRKNPSVYAAKLDGLNPNLRREIEMVLEWKTAENVPGRDAKLAIRPPSAWNLRKILLQLCGFANRWSKKTAD